MDGATVEGAIDRVSACASSCTFSSECKLVTEASYSVGRPELMGVLRYDTVLLERGGADRSPSEIGRLKLCTGRAGA
jgi:hypothetical protein